MKKINLTLAFYVNSWAVFNAYCDSRTEHTNEPPKVDYIRQAWFGQSTFSLYDIRIILKALIERMDGYGDYRTFQTCNPDSYKMLCTFSALATYAMLYANVVADEDENIDFIRLKRFLSRNWSIVKYLADYSPVKSADMGTVGRRDSISYVTLKEASLDFSLPVSMLKTHRRKIAQNA